jgi:site-specific DNA-cytosine methylase
VIDVFCGVGGFSAGGKAVGCNVVLGIDCEDSVLRLWAANTGGRGVMATLWEENIEWPRPCSDVHIHMSPPCTNLSKARAGATDIDDDVKAGVNCIQQALDLILSQGYQYWSLENVSTPDTRAILQTYVDANSDKVAYTTVDCADYSCCTNRVRLIAGPPTIIKRLREMPVKRLSVADAFAAAGQKLPAQYIRNSTRSRSGKPCIRSVHGAAHTQTASHPLTWCESDGKTVRCLTVQETSIIQGFSPDWLLPMGSRAGIRALGNAVPPPLSSAIMQAACEVKRAETGQS